MPLLPDRSRTSDVVLLLFGIGVLLLVSRARTLWASGWHWLTPFALWLGLIVAAALASRPRKSRDS